MGPCTPILPATPHTPGSGMVTTPPRNGNPPPLGAGGCCPLPSGPPSSSSSSSSGGAMQQLPSMQQITGNDAFGGGPHHHHQQQQQQHQQQGGGNTNDFSLDDLNFDPSAIIGDTDNADLNVGVFELILLIQGKETNLVNTLCCDKLQIRAFVSPPQFELKQIQFFSAVWRRRSRRSPLVPRPTGGFRAGPLHPALFGFKRVGGLRARVRAGAAGTAPSTAEFQ